MGEAEQKLSVPQTLRANTNPRNDAFTMLLKSEVTRIDWLHSLSTGQVGDQLKCEGGGR